MSLKQYEVPWLADFFHSFPHIDLTFQRINSTFNPESPRYRESLLFWAALPVLWLLVTLLIFLMYFCYRCCCQKEADKKRKGTCLPWAMAILALFTCAAIGVGFYGNEDAHKGVIQFATAAEDADNTIHNMQEQGRQLHDEELMKTTRSGGPHQATSTIMGRVLCCPQINVYMNGTVEPRLEELKKLFQRHVRINETTKTRLQELTNEAMLYTSRVLASVEIINNKAQRIDLSHAVYHTRTYGYYRWMGTILLLCWEILLCLLLLFGIGKASKCTLLVFCAFGIFSLVLCWVCAGMHLGASVALGDFCVAPDVYMEKLGMNSMDKEVVIYYIKCNKQVSNPFSRSLKIASDSVTLANNSIVQAVKMAESVLEKWELSPTPTEMNDALEKTVTNIQQLTALVDCTNIHKDYKDAVEGICYMALPGVAFILLSAILVGFLLTILVLLASCAWRHFGGPRKGYIGIDEEDAFLPRTDDGSPSYYSFPRGRHTNPREHVPMHRRSSPPPAVFQYSTNEFYRQFNDVTPNMDERPMHSHAHAVHAHAVHAGESQA